MNIHSVKYYFCFHASTTLPAETRTVTKAVPASVKKCSLTKLKLVIRGRRGRGLEIAHPDYDPAHTHEISTLVGTAHVAGWSLHMNEAAFGNGARDIGRFRTLAEPIQPVRSVFLRDIGSVITVRHGASPLTGKIKPYHGCTRLARTGKPAQPCRDTCAP